MNSNGINFFIENNLQFSITMWSGFIMSFKNSRISDQIFLNKKLIKNYFKRIESTIYYIDQWLSGDISSISHIKKKHDTSREKLKNQNVSNPINNSDFKFIQYCFIGMVFLKGKEYNFKNYNDQNLLDFAKNWAIICKELGINDCDNICLSNEVDIIRIKLKSQNDILRKELLKETIYSKIVFNFIIEECYYCKIFKKNKENIIKIKLIKYLDPFLIIYYLEINNLNKNSNILNKLIVLFCRYIFILI